MNTTTHFYTPQQSQEKKFSPVPPPMFAISLFQANNDHKLYDVVNGTLENTGGQDMTHGTIVPRPNLTLEGLYEILKSGQYNYLGGIPLDGDYEPRPLTTKKNVRGRAISRSLDCLGIDFSTGYIQVTIDIDSTAQHPRSELERDLYRVLPMLAETSRIVSYSSSAGIFKADGTLAKDKDGRHIVFVLKCSSKEEFEEFKVNLRRHTWLQGAARFDLGTPNKNTGRSAALERSCIDFATFQPAQPIFERGAELTQRAQDAGFYQQRPAPEFYQGIYEYIDAKDFSLTLEQIAEADRLKAAAKAAITGTQTAQQTLTLISSGKAPKEAQEIVKQSIAAENGGALEPGFLLYPSDGSAPILAGDLNESHHGLLLKSVLEPDYRGGSQTAKVWVSKFGITITDLAHGVCKKYVVQPKKSEFEKTDQERRDENLLKRFQQWSQARAFTPDMVIDSPYLPALPVGVDLAVRSGMGTGKTHAMAYLMANWDKGVCLLGSRNSLLLQTAERINAFAPDNAHRIVHIHDGVDDADLMAGEGRVALCFDSILRLPELYFSDKLVAIDEACAGMLHVLIGNTIENRRFAILGHFEKLIQHAPQVVLLDGNLSDRVCNWIEGIRNKPLHRVHNTHQIVTLNVEMLIPEKMRDKSFLQYQAIAALEAGHKIAYVSDSQIECEAIDQKASDMGKKVFRIDSKTMSDPLVKAQVRCPAFGAFLVAESVDLVVLSPSAESGTDISTSGWFSKGFASFYGVLDTNAQTQILRRVREIVQWQVCCVEQSISDDNQNGTAYDTTLRNQAKRIAQEEINAVTSNLPNLSGEDRDYAIQRIAELSRIVNDDPHNFYFFQLKADRNFERQNTRKCLIHALESQGHQVRLVDAPEDPAIKEEIKQIKSEIKEREAQLVFDSPSDRMTVDQARRVASSFNAPLEKQREAKKILFLHRLPGIQESVLWSVTLIYDLMFGDRQMLRRLENVWIAMNLGTGAKKSAQRIANILQGLGYVADIRANLATIQYLVQIGLFSLVGEQDWFGADHPRLQEIFNRVRRSKKARDLNVAPYRNETAARWANRILRSWFGVQIQSRKSQTGGDGREYQYLGFAHTDLLPFVGKYLEGEYQDNPLENCHVNNPQSLTGQGVEDGRRILYLNSHSNVDELTALVELLKLSQMDGTFEEDLAVLGADYPAHTLDWLRNQCA